MQRSFIIPIDFLLTFDDEDKTLDLGWMKDSDENETILFFQHALRESLEEIDALGDISSGQDSVEISFV